jgi:hypothetical protein
MARRQLRWFLSLVLLCLPITAAAHGSAEWIMNTHAECCGPEDCAALPTSDVEVKPGGYYIKSRAEFIPFYKAKPTDPNQRYPFWLCVILKYDGAETSKWPNGKTRCFFAPQIRY